jgi:cation diffusion facilitator family transporter
MTDEKTTAKSSQIANVLLWSVAMATSLVLAKFIAAFLTRSMSILASALDSGMDLATSAANFYMARAASKPPDREHEYGHAKIESLAGLFQSLFFILVGLFLVLESSKRLIYGAEIRSLATGIGVMAVSLSLTLLLVIRLFTLKKRYHSLILESEWLHYSMDILSNLGVAAALLLVRWTGMVFWDLVLSILVALYIFKNAYSILRRSIDELLDRSLGVVPESEIESLVRSHDPKIAGMHDFRSRRVGEQIFLDFHIVIRDENDFQKAHDITESLADKIREKYKPADVVIHFDPEGAR